MSQPPDKKAVPATGDWLAELFRLAGLAEGSALPRIAESMNALAVAAAPVARSWWKWLILIQGASVVAPLLWLLRGPFDLRPGSAALFTLLAVSLLVAALWWVRWRGMQHTWARARLVAEVARSRLAAAVCPEPLVLHALDAVPEVRRLPAAPALAAPLPWPQWKDAWIEKRVDDQLKFFGEARDKAERIRRNSSRWTTLFMDVALMLAVAGLIIAFTWRPLYFRAYRIEVILGGVGALLPLGIILLQSLRHFQELRRRTAGFTAQIEMLELAKRQLHEAPSPEAAMRIVTATEDKLLTEVVDWYYETEAAEQFFRVREWAAKAAPSRPAPHAGWRRPVGWALALGGVGLAFLVRVVIGRIGWLVLAVAVALGWVNYVAPKDAETRSQLWKDATLSSEQGGEWEPSVERAEVGCIIIAHGLHDGAILQESREEDRWMKRMAREFPKSLGPHLPNIALVNWENAAQPAKVHGIAPGFDAGNLVVDVLGIRPNAEEVGDFLSLRLAQLIREGKLRQDRPLHFIGHSAGGFLVTRAALNLAEWKIAPASMHVTILDTPGADGNILNLLPRSCPVDFYITSGFVAGLEERDSPVGKPGMFIRKIPSPHDPLSKEAHRDVYRWFTETISAASAGSDGFGRSPFCPRR